MVPHREIAVIFTGPPVQRQQDGEVVRRFSKMVGRKIVCGGTTAKIVARHFGQPLEVDLKTIAAGVPPIGKIKGIALVSEGILTLTMVNKMLASGTDMQPLQHQSDGASKLLRILLEVDYIHFMVGLAVNPVHQNPDLPLRLRSRMAVVREIAEELKRRGKEVTVETACRRS